MFRILIAIVAASLAACSEPPPMSAIDYAERLGRVLDEQLIEVEEGPRLAFPRPRELQHSFANHSIGLLDFLSLQGCELQAVVAEKNSSMGRMAGPSQQLIQDLRFLQTGASCLAQLSDQNLIKALNLALIAKRQELPARIWQATLAGPEFRSFWQFKAGEPIDLEAVRAITLLRQDAERWLAGDYATNASVFESRLQKVSKGNGGALLNNWRTLSTTLPVATAVLHQRHKRKPLCFPEMKPPEADIFFSVVQSGFLFGIQKNAAPLNRETYDVMTELQAFETLLSVAQTDSYVAWLEHRQLIVDEGRQVLKSHVDALEPLLQQCGFL